MGEKKASSMCVVTLVEVAREAGDRGIAGALIVWRFCFGCVAQREENYVLCITLTFFVYALCHTRSKSNASALDPVRLSTKQGRDFSRRLI